MPGPCFYSSMSLLLYSVRQERNYQAFEVFLVFLPLCSNLYITKIEMLIDQLYDLTSCEKKAEHLRWSWEDGKLSVPESGRKRLFNSSYYLLGWIRATIFIVAELVLAMISRSISDHDV